MTNHANEVVVFVEVDGSLDRALGSRDSLHGIVHQEISRQLTELLETLGIPGRPTIQITAQGETTTPGGQFMRVFVNGQLCLYPDELLQRVHSYVSGIPLGPASRPAQILAWLCELSNGQREIDVKHNRIVEFLHMACLEIVIRQPAVLLGTAQVIAYGASLPNPTGELDLQPGTWPPDPAWLRAVLGEAINLKISIAQKEKVARLLQKGMSEGRVPADIAEELIASLSRNLVVEIHLPPDYRDQITKASSATPGKGFASLRQFLFNEFGLRYPAFRFVAAPNLKPHSFALRINDITSLPRIGLVPDQRMVAGNLDELRKYGIQGSPTVDPLYRAACTIVHAEAEQTARAHDVLVWDPLAYLCLCLNADLQESAPCFVHCNAVQEQFDQLRRSTQDLVEAVKAKASIEQITRVLRSLISEAISIRNLRLILELLLAYDYIVTDPSRYLIFDDRLPTLREPDKSWPRDLVNLASFVRRGLKLYLSHKYTDDHNRLNVYLLDQQIERSISADLATETHTRERAWLTEDKRVRILGAVRARFEAQPPPPFGVSMLTAVDARPVLRDILAQEFPRLPIIAYEELLPNVSIEPMAELLSTRVTDGKSPIFQHPILPSRLRIVSTSRFDDRDRQIEKIEYNSVSKFLQSTAVYNDKGYRITEISYLDHQGKPTLDRDGHAKWTQKHDNLRHLREVAFFDSQNRPALYHGYVRCTALYNCHGKRIEGAYFGPNGEPAATFVDGISCSRWTATYDEQRHQAEKVYFGEGGIVFRSIARYDDTGNPIEGDCFHSDGTPATIDMNGVPCCRWEARYDDNGILLEKHYFDTGGMQVLARDPSLQFSVMCLEVVEEDNGQRPPTFRYLIYELPLPHLPFRVDFHVNNGWVNGLGSFRQSIKILYPDKLKSLADSGEQTFVLEDPYTPFLGIFKFENVEFTEQGKYWIQNHLNGKLVLEYPLTVRVLDGEKERATKAIGSHDRP